MVCRLARFWLISRDLRLDDLDAGLIGAFLEHLRSGRHNGARTRNARLTAIHSLLRYAALRHPEHAALIQRVLAIPPARFGKTVVSFLTRGEAEALLAAPARAWAPARTSGAPARAARNAAPRSPRRWPGCCGHGWTSAAAGRATRSSPPAAGSRSAATRSSYSSPATREPRRRPAPHSPPRPFRLMCCGTPPPCHYCTPGTTSP